jgi:hypothetical protein
MMQREVTPRVAGLIQAAIDLIDQAYYEGFHVQRGHPEPSVGSPWDRPDAPYEVLTALKEARQALEPALFENFSGTMRRIQWEEIA